MPSADNTSLAGFLDGLARTMAQAAETARKLEHDDAQGLPPILYTRHIARHQHISPVTAWRRMRLGHYGRMRTLKPGTIDRAEYLRAIAETPEFEDA